MALTISGSMMSTVSMFIEWQVKLKLNLFVDLQIDKWVQWSSGRALESSSTGRGFFSHLVHCKQP